MGLFSNLVGFASSAKPVVPALNGTLELIAGTLGNHITTAHDYRQRIVPAINSAVEYFDRQVATIPGPIEVQAAAYRRSPFVRAVFPSADEIRFALGRSLETREALPVLARSNQGQVHALLGMRCRPDHQTPGQAPVFADHTVKCLALNEAESRKAISYAAFSRLVKCFGDHLNKLREKERLLAIEWNIENEARPAERLNGTKEIVYAEQELTADKMVNGLVAWLQRPAEHLRIVRSDVCVAGDKGDDGIPFFYDLPVLQAADRRHWIVSIVKFPLQEGIDALNQESRSHRYIFI